MPSVGFARVLAPQSPALIVATVCSLLGTTAASTAAAQTGAPSSVAVASPGDATMAPPPIASASPPDLAGAPAPVPVPPTADALPAPDTNRGAGARRVVPTVDATPAASDHDAVVDAWGVELRHFSAALPITARNATTGCPSPASLATTGVTTVPCPDVDLNGLGVRRWISRNIAVTGGLAFAAGGGRASGRVLDTYFGVGPIVGVSVLLTNWRHVAVLASPDLSVVGFRASSGGRWSSVTDLRADLEAEVHFGFIGLPALSAGVRSGLRFRLEHAGRATLWSVGVGPGSSVIGFLNQLLLRYYF